MKKTYQKPLTEAILLLVESNVLDLAASNATLEDYTSTDWDWSN